MDTHIFHVKGMHCNACVVLTESELSELPGVSRAKATLETLSVEVTGDFGDKTPEKIAAELSTVLTPHGYSLLLDRPAHAVVWSDFRTAVPLALLFVGFFILLQKLGIVNLVTADHVTYGTAFLVGLIASVSTCMAVVGGLVLSMSSTFAKGGDTVRPQVLFHAGRLIGFFLLGGVIGALGSAFQLGATGTFVLSFGVAIVLLILGINLLDIFPWAKKLQLAMPTKFGTYIHGMKKVEHTLMPFVIGVATFFLPCGFTQSMQVYSLSTGSFWAGAGTMFAFSLGTLPVLSLLSFGSLAIKKVQTSGIFFKTAGLVVIFFGLLNLISSLTAIGILPQIINF